MNESIRGRLAAVALCALLFACGGGGTPPATVLPASVTIANDARAEAGSAANFKTDLAATQGLSFRWDFGDGSTGAGATASHAYARPGTYQVTLAVANSDEDMRTATSTIRVGAYANVSGLTCSRADSAGWCWQHAIATGHQINDVFFVDATHAWAVGADLTILKSTDAGTTWTPVAIDPAIAAVSLRTVRFYDATHGMALDDQGGALQTHDGGSTWTATAFGGITYGSALNFIDYSAGRIIVQGTYSSGAAMSVDGGATWTYVAAYGPIQAMANDCWSFNSGAVQRAPDCGATLMPGLSSYIANGYQNFVASAFSSDMQGFVIGNGYSYATGIQGALGWSTTDGGATWTSFTPAGLSPYSYNYYGMSLQMADPQAGVLYAPNGLTAYATPDAGHTWMLITPATSLSQGYNTYRATGFAGNVLWQSAGSRVAISADRGLTWQEIDIAAEDAASQNGQSTAATVTQYTDANDFVVAVSHRFYVTNDGGQTFRRLLGPDPRDAGSSYAAGEFSDFHNGKFLTANGALLSTADGGRTWTRTDYANSNATPVALHFTSATEGWLVLGGKLAHSTDGGATWTIPLTNSAMTNLQGMSWGDATHGWVWNGLLFYTADAGVTWTQASLPNSMGVSYATMTGARTGIVASGYGGVQITQDGGATWQAVNATGWFGPLVRAGQAVWSSSGNGLQRSKDGGRTWQAAGPVLGNASVTGLAFADDTHGWLITNGGGVLRTIDGGDSWTAQPVGTDLSLQAVVAVDPMTAWIITRDGQILATATAGE